MVESFSRKFWFRVWGEKSPRRDATLPSTIRNEGLGCVNRAESKKLHGPMKWVEIVVVRIPPPHKSELQVGTCKEAVMAHWVCLHLPSYGPGFESQAQHLHFIQFILNCGVRRTKIKTKVRELANILKGSIFPLNL